MMGGSIKQARCPPWLALISRRLAEYNGRTVSTEKRIRPEEATT